MKIYSVLILSLLCVCKSVFGTESNEHLSKQLRYEIILLNLVNSLYLTSDQMQLLTIKIHEAEEIRNSTNQHKKDKESEFEIILRKIKQHLLRNEEIPESIKKQFHQMKGTFDQIEHQNGQLLKDLEQEVVQQLNENQILSIETYRPCMIPPKQGRIGQSVELKEKGIINMLDHIRYMDNKKFQFVKYKIIKRNISRLEKHSGIMTQEEKQEHKIKMENTLEKVRNLSDKKFFLQKNMLAREFLPEENLVLHHQRKNDLSRIGRFLLDPVLLPILENKLEQG